MYRFANKGGRVKASLFISYLGSKVVSLGGRDVHDFLILVTELQKKEKVIFFLWL